MLVITTFVLISGTSPCTVCQRVAGKVHQTLRGVGSKQTALRFQGSSDKNKNPEHRIQKKYFY